MDSDDKMMIHQITEEKPNAAVDVLDEDEHMVILACVCNYMRKEENTAPKHGWSKFGRNKSKPR
jgi:hypothetical protein